MNIVRIPMIVRPDDYLLRDGKYDWTQVRVSEAWQMAKASFTSHLEFGQPERVALLVGCPGSGKSTWLKENGPGMLSTLFFDACFDSAWMREPFIQAAKAKSIPVEVYWFVTPIEVCVERNNQRSEDRKIPLERLLDIAGAIEHKTPCMESEGFDALHFVHWAEVAEVTWVDTYRASPRDSHV